LRLLLPFRLGRLASLAFLQIPLVRPEPLLSLTSQARERLLEPLPVLGRHQWLASPPLQRLR
jgi:hypothetical protein